MVGKLETVGYAAPDTLLYVTDFLSQPGAVLIDIRFSPRSRWQPVWNKSALHARYGAAQYQHIKALGNVNYNKPDLPIHLLNPDEALPSLVSMLQGGASLLFLCACKDYNRCHRKVVYELVMDALQAASIKESEVQA
jgi:hypothetical protein